jgi:hypothetical protein
MSYIAIVFGFCFPHRETPHRELQADLAPQTNKEHQVHIVVDPEKLPMKGVSSSEFTEAFNSDNQQLQPSTLKEFLDLPICVRGGQRVCKSTG